MIKIHVKLYSILWLAYRKDNEYDLEKGIIFETETEPTVLELCKALKLDTKKVTSFSRDGKIDTNLNEKLHDGDVVGIYPTTPMGG